MLGLPSVSDREAGAANRAFFWAAVVGVLLLVPLDVFVQQFHRGLRERTVRSPARDVAMSERVEAPGIGVLTLQSKYHVRIREYVALKGMRFEEQPDWRAVVADLERLAESRVERTRVAIGAAHPYGMSGLVMVTIAGIGFGLLREWRGSLVAPITMHALHNGWISIREVWILAAID